MVSSGAIRGCKNLRTGKEIRFRFWLSLKQSMREAAKDGVMYPSPRPVFDGRVSPEPSDTQKSFWQYLDKQPFLHARRVAATGRSR